MTNFTIINNYLLILNDIFQYRFRFFNIYETYLTNITTYDTKSYASPSKLSQINNMDEYSIVTTYCSNFNINNFSFVPNNNGLS